MWRSKKFIIAAVLMGVLLVGSIGGVVLADEGDEAASEPGARLGALWERACEIYKDNTGDDIDQEVLRSAIDQAQGEMHSEAMQNRLQNMVEQGRLTQEEADEYLQWQQSRPDVPVKFGFGGRDKLRGMFGSGGQHPPVE